MDKNKIGAYWHLFLVVFLLFATVHGGKDRVDKGIDRNDGHTSAEDPSAVPRVGESEVAGSSSVSMGTAPGSLGMGGTGASSYVKYDKYADPYSDKYGSSIYPSSSAQHESAVNYYSAYGYPNPLVSSSSSSSGSGSYKKGNKGSSSNSYPYSYSGSSHTNYYSPYMTSDPNYERGGRDFNTPAASSNYAYEIATAPEYGGQAMASSHGHGHGHGYSHSYGYSQGHGHDGGGGGWKAQQYSGGQVDTSAIGLLGLLALFALMQQALRSLTTTTTTTTMAGRKKRDLFGIGDDSEEIPEPAVLDDGSQRVHEISVKVLPSFNLIAHAREGRVPLSCTHREVCLANQLLVKELGLQGRSVGSLISSAITKLLKETDKSGSIGKDVFKAGFAGRSGENCEIIYPVCSALHKKGVYSLPLLVQPHHLAHITPTGGIRSESNLPKTKPNTL